MNAHTRSRAVAGFMRGYIPETLNVFMCRRHETLFDFGLLRYVASAKDPQKSSCLNEGLSKPWQIPLFDMPTEGCS